MATVPMQTSYSSRYEVDLTQMLVYEGPPEFLPEQVPPVPETCVICLEVLGQTSMYRQLPCKHLFHQPCIDDWICNRDTKCPICRETFYHLRHLRNKGNTPRKSLSREEISRNRRDNDVSFERIISIKIWCKKKLRGHGVTTTVNPV
ncbi:uncharacterized protein N7503_006478 [Penicillium pulvis]|uniref:uncharacterized protein n=1 Tax=Penicillium pulvis TaxID=1562058 RepID=UPI002546A2AE|nr:uncharacterized protein N7503_006478 [Penicillium pulvis]KAJ5798973.1 hypothetical protein N7503_006478 [Penicillium pulvis]